MTKIKFDEFISKQSSEIRESDIDWSKNRDEWLEYLKKFQGTILSYLDEYILGGQVRITCDSKKILEEYVGEYEAETIIIHLGKNKVRLDPIGTNLIGAKGRVDMIGPNGKVKFVLVDKNASAPRISIEISVRDKKLLPEVDTIPEIEWVWKISTPPPRIKYIELNSESFFDAFMEVANG